jgi:beta-lactamase superfamily II metal-dependent hydrolase
MRFSLLLTVILAAGSNPNLCADTPARGLDIYFIDVEGGAATLIVTPLGESVLIDCGNPGPRDADRIFKAATQQAGLKAIDHLAITHWHLDHYGSVDRLTKLIPIHHFYDRGIPETLAEDPQNFPVLIQAYKMASKGKATTLKPGDEIPLKQTKDGLALHLLCLSSGGEVLPEPPNALENPVAKTHKPMPEDKTDNAKSLGFLASFGGFRFLDLGDLTWNIEYKLVHPADKIGPVDVYQSTHHGLEISNNPVVIQTVQPRVAIFNNGAKKGCHPNVTTTLRRVPGIQAIYQMHRNLNVGAQENTDPEFIANLDEKCQGESIKLAVSPDGKSYRITVGSRGKSRTYETRSKP